MSDVSPEQPRARRISLPLAALLAAALLVGCLAVIGEYQAWSRGDTPPDARPSRGDGRIVAGQRVDFITLGLPMAEVAARLGAGKVRPQKDTVLYVYDQAGLSVAARDGRVDSVLVLNPNLQTADGVGVGKEVDPVVRSFGDHYDYEARSAGEYTLHYWSQGIHFTVRSARITSILVTQGVVP